MTNKYAFDDFYALQANLGGGAAAAQMTPTEKYVCALVAELAYYYIPPWEIDPAAARAKLLPSVHHARVVQAGSRIKADIASLFGDNDFRVFVAADRAAVAVGFSRGSRLFVGFRGTRFWFDWSVNFRFGRTWTPSGRFHNGFAEEVARISVRIRQAALAQGIDLSAHEEIYIGGHSLGGAVAAISAVNLFRHPRRHAGWVRLCTFGAPRVAAGGCPFFDGREASWLQVRHIADQVPMVPPKFLGYWDAPVEEQERGSLPGPRQAAVAFGVQVPAHASGASRDGGLQGGGRIAGRGRERCTAHRQLVQGEGRRPRSVGVRLIIGRASHPPALPRPNNPFNNARNHCCAGFLAVSACHTSRTS